MSDFFSMSQDECWQMLKKFDFGTFITPDFNVSHLPYVVNDNKELYFHIAKKNPLINGISDNRCLFTILGPHGLVETDHYIVKPAVPTWNYLSIKLTGYCHLIDEDKKKSVMLETLKRFQPSLMDDKSTLPDKVFSNLLSSITVFKFKIETIDGIAKLSQNRSCIEQENIINYLNNSNNEALGSLMKGWLQSTKQSKSMEEICKCSPSSY